MLTLKQKNRLEVLFNTQRLTPEEQEEYRTLKDSITEEEFEVLRQEFNLKNGALLN